MSDHYPTDWRLDDDDTPDPLREALEAPLRRQARSIARLAHALVSSLPEPGAALAPPDSEAATEQEMQENVKGYVLENAYLLGAKLANARSSTDFGHRLEMAVLIKRAACELHTQVSFLGSLAGGQLPAEYVAALRAEVEEFRRLFVPWVASFDPTDHYDDGWGLFGRLLPPQPD